jgi:hypothetical protein
MEADKSAEKTKEASVDKPPHCIPTYHPSQIVTQLQTIRFFSDFDSANLLKVRNVALQGSICE